MNNSVWMIGALLLSLLSVPAHALKGSDPEHTAKLARMLTIQDQVLPAKKQTRQDIQEQLQRGSDPDYLFVPAISRNMLVDPTHNPFENAPGQPVLIRRADLINLLTVSESSADRAARALQSLEHFSASYKQQLAAALARTEREIESLTAALQDLRRELAAEREVADVDPSASSAHGKYADLIQVMTCPADHAAYGAFRDYGYWQGGAWCGQMGQAGYWVWVNPNWYVWRKLN